MKHLSQDKIEELSKFKSKKFLTTSFYFDTDKSRLIKKEISVSFKNLLNSNKSQIDKIDLSKEKKASLEKDLGKIERFFKRNIGSYNNPGLALFSCHGEVFWEEFILPDPPRNRIIFDHNPYVRPLSAILNEHKRICIIILDRKKAIWYEISVGGISLLKSLEGNVPSKVKEGGWEGYESKRIERRTSGLLRDYFKNSAKVTFELFKKNKYEWLFIGCVDNYLPDFEPLLHPYLKKRLKGHLRLKPNDSQDKILKESLKLEKELKHKEDEEAVDRFISELKKGGLATSGLRDTLRRLNRGEVQTLLVTRYFSKPGRSCPRCSLLYVDEVECPSCQRKTEKVTDVIDEAVEKAIDKKCRIKHLDPPSKLRRYRNIGALLRYKT
jgi:peptide subunit release factor 1 (eRF1)